MMFVDYLPWDEQQVESCLIGEYDWEVSKSTNTTWRIGDGTAAFYNYIYYTVAGFTEFDTFRSNQIRNGAMSREEAMRKVSIENRPDFQSLLWYFDTVNVDFKLIVSAINGIRKLYRKRT